MMTRKELDEEIEYVHRNIPATKLLRPFEKIWNVIVEVTNTYTNISLFMNDYIRLFNSEKIDELMYNSAMNDLYLLALLHTTCDEDLEHDS